MHLTKNPLVLLILDGFGCRKEQQYNAIAQAKTPNLDRFWQTYPHTLIEASGEVVGLPPGQMGNSEVGHMHIGAGRIIDQQLSRINKAIQSGNFARHPLLLKQIHRLKKDKKTLHVMGLLSKGGVHSHEDHLMAFLNLCLQEQFHQVVLHLFLDGRDSPPHSALESIIKLEDFLKHNPVATIASISGRYYAMDRDNRWDRIQAVYDCLVTPNKSVYQNASTALRTFYAKNISDEFIPPTPIGALKPIAHGDAVFFFNFRADRARQLTRAFVDPSFSGFHRIKSVQLLDFISMSTYDEQLKTTAVFPSATPDKTLGQIISEAGLNQLRLAETEKYAHVTFFFNGGTEAVFPKEERLLIASEKVTTYDLTPNMRALEITKSLIQAIESHQFDVIICNYANADMIGHTGNFEAAVETIECLDNCLGQVAQSINKNKGHLLITADHGNAEIMFDETTNEAHTAHTSELVPFIYIGENKWQCRQNAASLIDLAPTILLLLGLPKPKEMTGHSLLEPTHG